MADDPWVDDASAALLTDQYQLTMLQAYWRERMFDSAVFSLFVRRLPEGWNYLLACGLDDALRYLERVRFDGEALDYLATLGGFSADFLDWLRDFRFTGSVDALPEGTPFFAEEPILVVEAPLPEAQLVETFLMNQVHLQTLLASKAARVVAAAEGRTVADFGLRRIHGTDAGLKGARAFWIAGVDGTSNVLAGRAYGIPVTGTMAHSYVQAHDDERAAFRAFSALYPDTVLLVDTYDTLQGVRHVVELAEELGADFAVRGIRLDSGDLAALARGARRILDEAGLASVGIIASGGLDEHEVGRGRLKLSPGKGILPGRNQVWRQERDGGAVRDVIAPAVPDGDAPQGRPLLRRVMEGGVRVDAGREDLDTIRLRARTEVNRLPPAIRRLEPADPAYTAVVSDELRRRQARLAERLRPGTGS